MHRNASSTGLTSAMWPTTGWYCGRCSTGRSRSRSRCPGKEIRTWRWVGLDLRIDWDDVKIEGAGRCTSTPACASKQVQRSSAPPGSRADRTSARTQKSFAACCWNTRASVPIWCSRRLSFRPVIVSSTEAVRLITSVMIAQRCAGAMREEGDTPVISVALTNRCSVLCFWPCFQILSNHYMADLCPGGGLI